MRRRSCPRPRRPISSCASTDSWHPRGVSPQPSGVHDVKVARVAAGGMHDRKLKNSSRHLHKFMSKNSFTLKVPMTMVMTPLRARRFARRCKVLREPWPVLHLRDWVRTAFQAPWLGAFFLAGHRLPDLQKAEDLLEQFWERQFFADGQRPRSPRRTIPYYIHGDEGRGQAKRPVEVIGFQPVLPWSGEGHTSMEKSLARPIRVGWFFLVEAFFGFCGVRPGTHSVRGWSTRCFHPKDMPRATKANTPCSGRWCKTQGLPRVRA